PDGGGISGVRGGSGRATTGDVRLGVTEWLAAQGVERSAPGPGASGPPPDDPAAQGPEADHEAVARKILLDQLTGRARSRSELATKLARKGVPEEITTRLLDRFEEVGLVDDEAFARSWVESRQVGKGLATRALAQELRRKGVEEEVARGVLDEVDPADEVETARTLVRRKLRSVQRLERDAAVRRLAGMLARKGYPPGIAFQVVREELERAGRDAEDLDVPWD
ncbi:MAG: regulatory protein RecX, partial [Actinomycetes bacterium]